jgi:hypothetical protein
MGIILNYFFEKIKPYKNIFLVLFVLKLFLLAGFLRISKQIFYTFY